MNPSDYPLALWPPSASAAAVDTDHLILAFTVLTLVLVLPIFVGFTWFAIVYRNGRPANRKHAESHSERIELSWMIIPFLLTLFFFVWGAWSFDTHRHPPANAMQISAIGRQWMWKFEHPGGQAEINNLHLPAGQPIVINMISQDVIHSLYIPAMRIQMETLPDRYTLIWFNSDRPGTYRLYCSEYCGTDHSNMDGLLTIMKPADYQAWLAQSSSGQSLASAGKALFASYGCSGCHNQQSTVRAPTLAGFYGKPVALADGRTVTADDSFIRGSILDPNKNAVAGYKQVMPSMKGLMSEDDLARVVAYVKARGQQGEQAP
ncbi:cytochrome c oxidase subunit II [Rhodopila sp.]|uniref:cytochrome c oxidase subunit II n=1 Tax=Rhodopila sp. TaxID=2480087 RepID=UPI003D1163CC